MSLSHKMFALGRMSLNTFVVFVKNVYDTIGPMNLCKFIGFVDSVYNFLGQMSL